LRPNKRKQLLSPKDTEKYFENEGELDGIPPPSSPPFVLPPHEQVEEVKEEEEVEEEEEEEEDAEAKSGGGGDGGGSSSGRNEAGAERRGKQPARRHPAPHPAPSPAPLPPTPPITQLERRCAGGRWDVALHAQCLRVRPTQPRCLAAAARALPGSHAAGGPFGKSPPQTLQTAQLLFESSDDFERLVLALRQAEEDDAKGNAVRAALRGREERERELLERLTLRRRMEGLGIGVGGVSEADLELLTAEPVVLECARLVGERRRFFCLSFSFFLSRTKKLERKCFFFFSHFFLFSLICLALTLFLST